MMARRQNISCRNLQNIYILLYIFYNSVGYDFQDIYGTTNSKCPEVHKSIYGRMYIRP